MRDILEVPFRNEADVQRLFVPNLLKLLDYTPASIYSEACLSVLEGAHGRKRRLLARPDFLVKVDGRSLFVIETKTPTSNLGAQDLDQVFSYARHLEVQAPFCMLTNGHRIVVYRSNSKVPVFELSRSDLQNRLRDLALLIGRNIIGSRFGSVSLEERLGVGAYGEVFKAYNPVIRRHEAIKIYRPELLNSGWGYRRIQQGMKAHQRLEHPQIARLYWADWIGTDFAISMKFVDGLPLDKWLVQKLPSFERRLDVVAQTAGVIGYAHSMGVFHRDLKPSNIIVTEDQGKDIPVIVDFDTAVSQNATAITRTQESIGTVGFQDPHMETSAKRRSRRRSASSDIYSLGAILYFVLAGEAPPPVVSARSLRSLEARLAGVPRLPKRLRNAAMCLFVHATEPMVEARYTSAVDFMKDLNDTALGHRLGAKDESKFVKNFFSAFDELVLKGGVASTFKNIVYRSDAEIGRITNFGKNGEMHILYDSDYRFFMIGFMFDTQRKYQAFLLTNGCNRLKKQFRGRLRAESVSLAERGGVYVQHPVSLLVRSTPESVARMIADEVNIFLGVLEDLG